VQESSIRYRVGYEKVQMLNLLVKSSAKLVKFAHVNTRFAANVLNVMNKIRLQRLCTCAGVRLVLRIKGKL